MTLTFDLLNPIRPSVEASEYSQSVLSIKTTEAVREISW